MSERIAGYNLPSKTKFVLPIMDLVTIVIKMKSSLSIIYNYINKLTWQIYSLVSKEQASCDTPPIPSSWKCENFTEAAHIIFKGSRPYITNS